MILRYELWDMDTANQIGSFSATDEAIAVVTDYLKLNGTEGVSDLVLGAVFQDDTGTVSMIPVLDGSDFVAIARAGARLDLTS